MRTALALVEDWTPEVRIIAPRARLYLASSRKDDGSICTYDEVGNVKFSTDANNTRACIYDGRNLRLTESHPLAAISNYQYDVKGNRVRQEAPERRLTTWAYDQRRRVHSETNSENETVTYTYDDNSTRTRQRDANGNTTLYEYDALNRQAAMYYFGARYYDPRTSVWQSADAILGKYLAGAAGGLGQPINFALYSYGRNNPIVYTDPDGNLAVHWHFIITFSASRDSGMGFWNSLSLAWRTMWADGGNTPLGAPSQGETPQSTVQHNMGGTFRNQGAPQSPDEAIAATSDFIDHYQQSDQYLPNAIHAAQDSKTPDHSGQPWPPKDSDGSTDKSGKFGHFWNDTFPSAETKKNAYDATRSVIDANTASPNRNKEPGVFNIEKPEYGYTPSGGGE